MPITLRAEIPFPEQAHSEQPLEVVFPRRLNDALYEQLQKIRDGKDATITAKTGHVTIRVEEVLNNPGVSERMNAALRTLDMVKIVRKGVEFVLVDFEPKVMPDEEGTDTMAGVIAEMQDEKLVPADQPSTGDTLVGMHNTGDTTPITKPGAKAPPRKLTDEERKAMAGMSAANNQADASLAAREMSKRLFGRKY